MREGFDKEIDSLLRRTARAPTGVRGNGAGASRPDSHLDADELAAFAEGALPEAARMSAVSHLADCGECRTHAVNLTRAAGVEAKLEKSAVAAASSTARESKPARGWLAALFAPRALRYVAPALVLCLVAAVSFVALRSRSDRGLVSLQESNRASARPSITTTQNNSQPLPEGPSTSGGANANANANANASPATTGASEAPRNDKSASETYVPKPENKDAREDAPDGSAASGTAGEKSAGADADAAVSPPAKKEEDDKPASGAPAPTEIAKSAPADSLPAPKYAEQHMKSGPPPSPAQNNDEVASNEQSQKRAGQRGLEAQSPDGGARNQSRAGANNSASGGALAGSARDDRESGARRESPPAAKRGHSGQDEKQEAERTNTVEESRSVAGHRFRREGGVWVDVNYKSRMPSTGVRRGTDAYRGLVADIPELGRIAEALGGEVLVVVRGRAYSIR
jgi:hypothetical protein